MVQTDIRGCKNAWRQVHASHVLKVPDIVRNQIYLEASPIMCHKQYLRFGPHKNEVISNFTHGAWGYTYFHGMYTQ